MIATVASALLVGVSCYAGTGFFGATAANIFANLATDWLNSISRFGDAALARYKGVGEDHVVVLGVRQAQLEALAAVLRRFDEARRGHRDPAQQAFTELMQGFLRREKASAGKPRFEAASGTTEAEERLRRDLVALLPDAAAAALAARTGPAQAVAGRKRFQQVCETAVLGEVRALVFEDIPPLFLSTFHGDQSGADGWFDLFFRRVAEEIKKGGPFAQVWQAEQVAAIARVVGDQAERTAGIAQAVQAIRDGLIAHGTALSALAGEVDAVREHVAAVHARTVGDAAFALDFPAMVDTTGHLRFAPRNPLVPFFGRGEEMAALRGFLEAPADFAWWLLCGSGGAGKTRLALRLAMLAHAEGWRAGFLPKSYAADATGLDAWQPRQPTLIVADYTLKRRDAVRVLAERLARRAGEHSCPMRLLLIERQGGEGFDAQFLAADSQGVIKPHRHADPAHGPELALSPLAEDDLWALAEGGRWHVVPRPLCLPRAAFFERLDGLDQERRPLVAMILADALSAEPARPAFDSLATELRRLLERDRRDLWPPALGCAEAKIGVPDADAVIAFATMLDGMEKGEFAALEAARGRTLDFDAAACAAALGASYDPDAPHLPPLEPDLIGEFFALEVLNSRDGFRGPRHPYMGEAAWHQRPDRMADFVRRAGQNFPSHPAIAPLQVPVPGIFESWRLRAFNLLFGAANLSAGLAAATDALRDHAMHDLAAAKAFAELSVVVTAMPDEATDVGLRRALVADIATAARAHPGAPLVRNVWSMAAFNYISRRAAEEAVACHALLNEMRAFAADNPSEPLLREHWAEAVNNLIVHRAAEEPAACRVLLDELRAFAADNPDEPILCKHWTKAACNYIIDRAAEEAVVCHTLLDELRALAEGNPDEPALREHWARAACNYIIDRAAEEAVACHALLNEMRALAEGNPGEPLLRERWAKAVFAYISRRATEEAVACHTLLDELRALAADNPNEPLLRERWAGAVNNYVSQRVAEEAATCHILLDELRALAEDNPDEPALREQWAKAAINYTVHRAAEEAAVCRTLLDALRALAADNPDEPLLREKWAKAVFAYISRRAAEEAAACRALLDELHALAADNPGEPLLREHWAKAAVNLIACRAAEESAACRALLDELRALAADNPGEPLLRERWAKAAFNYISQRAAEEAVACHALLDELRILAADNPDEPALREQRAWAASIYTNQCAAEEPVACRALLDELRALAADNPGEPVLRKHWAEATISYVRGRVVVEPMACRALLDGLGLTSIPWVSHSLRGA